jgi:hypothetical protein
MGPWRRESTRRAGRLRRLLANPKKTARPRPGPVGTAGVFPILPGAFWQLTWPPRCLESVPVPGESDQPPAIPPPGPGFESSAAGCHRNSRRFFPATVRTFMGGPRHPAPASSCRITQRAAHAYRRSLWEITAQNRVTHVPRHFCHLSPRPLMETRLAKGREEPLHSRNVLWPQA